MTQYYQCGTPTLMNSNLPTISIRTEDTVYPPALQIDLLKRLHRNITKVMVFIQECSCYCHPWNVDITMWSRPYHFIQNLQELYQQNVGATQINPNETCDVFHFDFHSHKWEIWKCNHIANHKIPELGTIKKKKKSMMLSGSWRRDELESFWALSHWFKFI